jgi:hypothetical protein
MPLPTDPTVDFRHAFSEGWTLEPCFQNGTPIWCIERLDHGLDAQGVPNKAVDPRFDQDEDALAFVQARAAEGSAYHQNALALDGQPRPAWVPAMGEPSLA